MAAVARCCCFGSVAMPFARAGLCVSLEPGFLYLLCLRQIYSHLMASNWFCFGAFCIAGRTSMLIFRRCKDALHVCVAHGSRRRVSAPHLHLVGRFSLLVRDSHSSGAVGLWMAGPLPAGSGATIRHISICSKPEWMQL